MLIAYVDCLYSYSFPDPTVFPGILSFLRSHKTTFLRQETESQLQLLLIEADFYQYLSLSEAIENELERRRLEEDLTQARTIANKNNNTYKIVSEMEASMWFDRGWAFVHQYKGNESYGCPTAPGYRVATFDTRGERGLPQCSVCKEFMVNYERFLKHTVLFTPCMFVISRCFAPTGAGPTSRSSSLSASLPTNNGTLLPTPSSTATSIITDEILAHLIAETTHALEGDALAFDQSFG